MQPLFAIRISPDASATAQTISTLRAAKRHKAGHAARRRSSRDVCTQTAGLAAALEVGSNAVAAHVNAHGNGATASTADCAGEGGQSMPDAAAHEPDQPEANLSDAETPACGDTHAAAPPVSSSGSAIRASGTDRPAALPQQQPLCAPAERLLADLARAEWDNLAHASQDASAMGAAPSGTQHEVFATPAASSEQAMGTQEVFRVISTSTAGSCTIALRSQAMQQSAEQAAQRAVTARQDADQARAALQQLAAAQCAAASTDVSREQSRSCAADDVKDGGHAAGMHESTSKPPVQADVDAVQQSLVTDTSVQLATHLTRANGNALAPDEVSAVLPDSASGVLDEEACSDSVEGSSAPGADRGSDTAAADIRAAGEPTTAATASQRAACLASEMGLSSDQTSQLELQPPADPQSAEFGVAHQELDVSQSVEQCDHAERSLFVYEVVRALTPCKLPS